MSKEESNEESIAQNCLSPTSTDTVLNAIGEQQPAAELPLNVMSLSGTLLPRDL